MRESRWCLEGLIDAFVILVAPIDDPCTALYLSSFLSDALPANFVQVHTVTAPETGLREQSLPPDIDAQRYRAHRNYPILSSLTLRRLGMDCLAISSWIRCCRMVWI